MSDQNNNQLVKSKNQLAKSSSPSIGAWIRNDLEKKIYLAPHGKTLANFKNSDMNELKNAIVQWIYYLGLTDKVDDKDIITLTKFTQEVFPNLTIEDIKLAINLSMKGSLDADIECYGNFSPLYISKILNAYLKFSNTKINEINWRKTSIEAQTQIEQEEPYENRVKSRRRIINNYINRIMQEPNKYVADFDSIIWGLMCRTKMIDPKNVDLVEAENWASQMAVQDSLTTEAKKYEKLGESQKQRELDIWKKLYGRFYVIRKVLQTIDKPFTWVEGLKDEFILPKNEKK
jgi:hypothetical protein